MFHKLRQKFPNWFHARKVKLDDASTATVLIKHTTQTIPKVNTYISPKDVGNSQYPLDECRAKIVVKSKDSETILNMPYKQIPDVIKNDGMINLTNCYFSINMLHSSGYDADIRRDGYLDKHQHTRIYVQIKTALLAIQTKQHEQTVVKNNSGSNSTKSRFSFSWLTSFLWLSNNKTSQNVPMHQGAQQHIDNREEQKKIEAYDENFNCQFNDTAPKEEYDEAFNRQLNDTESNKYSKKLTVENLKEFDPTYNKGTKNTKSAQHNPFDESSSNATTTSSNMFAKSIISISTIEENKELNIPYVVGRHNKAKSDDANSDVSAALSIS